MKIIQYFILANICLSISYLFYRILSRNNTNFNLLRYFLLVSLAISLFLPLSNLKFNFSQFSENKINVNTTNNSQIETKYKVVSNKAINQPLSVDKKSSYKVTTNWVLISQIIYLSITIFLVIRAIMQIVLLIFRYYQSEKAKHLHYTILTNSYYKNSFSFFNWIFISKEILLNEDKDKIIAHEMIHASQYHSFDLILIELISAAMWFNPIVWMMRKSMNLLHEYLADEGVLNNGFDKLSYQALLINQLTEEKLISISSSFNKSLKKRMNMMSKSKSNQKSKLKILALFPLSVMLILLVASINGLFPNSIKASPENSASNQSKNISKFQPKEIAFNEDTTKNRKVRKSRKDKISHEMKDTSTVSTSKHKTEDNSTFNAIDVTSNSNNLNSDTIKPLALMFPNKTYFQNMLTFPDYKMKTPSLNRNFDDLNNTLYIVDGIRTTINPISELNAGNIQSISVIKGNSLPGLGYSNYGTVIIVTSKLRGKLLYKLN